MSVRFGYYLLTLCKRYRIYLEYFDFCVWLWVLCVAFYLSFIWLFVRSIRFPLNCVFPWDVIFIFSSFHLISVSCPTTNKHISGFFQDSREQEKCVRKVFLDKFSSYSLFFHISHCSIYLLCLVMICWLDLCIIEINFNMFIMVWFVCFTFHFLFLISLFVGENSVISFSGVFMWSRLLWQAFLSLSLDFSGFSEAREVYEEVLLI